MDRPAAGLVPPDRRGRPYQLPPRLRLSTQDPLDRLTRWLDAATVEHPDAMTLATADARGRPSARIVILRGVGPEGLVFHTDHRSRKAREIAENPRVALLLHWERRQVRVEGLARRLSDEEADAEWAERPTRTRLVAIVSPQSDEIGSLAPLRDEMVELRSRHGDDLPRPPSWGGYRVRPDAVEFWEEARNGLHDRMRYERVGDGWRRTRLAP